MGEPAPARRVVSLVPSVTESLLSWGIRPLAVTRFCEQPTLPTVGGTKNPDVRAIAALAPDLVVMNDEENRREDADALMAAGLRIHVTRVQGVDDVDRGLEDLASAVGVVRSESERSAFRRIGTESVGSESAGSDSVGSESVGSDSVGSESTGRGQAGAASAGSVERRAFVPIWRRPWMTMNRATYGSSVLAHLGLHNVYADADARYPTVDLDDVAARRPDLVLLPSEPYPFGPRHARELDPLGVEVRLIDGQDLFWWGTRTPAALARLRHSMGP